MSTARKRGRPVVRREVRVIPVKRDEIDVRRLTRALLALAEAEKAKEASDDDS